MTIQEVNEALKQPIQFKDPLRGLVPNTTVHKTCGKTGIKWIGRAAYNRRNWLTALARELPPEPPSESFRATLYGEEGDKAYTALVKLGVPGQAIHTPQCAECRASAPVGDDGLCKSCHAAALVKHAKSLAPQTATVCCMSYVCGHEQEAEIHWIAPHGQASPHPTRAGAGEACPKCHNTSHVASWARIKDQEEIHRLRQELEESYNEARSREAVA